MNFFQTIFRGFPIRTAIAIMMVTMLIVSSTAYAGETCKVKFKLKSNSEGKVTITKVKSASVIKNIFGVYVTRSYKTQWTGSREVGIGKSTTFTFSVDQKDDPEHGDEGHKFKFVRLDGKQCSADYGSSRRMDYCTEGWTAVVSCGPNSWK